MKLKKEYIILALIIIGLSVYLFMRKGDRTLYELPVLPEVAKKDISKIEISKGDTSIVLNKKDEQWFIGPQQYPADQNKVKAMLDVLESLKLDTAVSESKDYIRYELNDAKKINVKAWQDDTLRRNFDVGKTASTFRHTFVKIDTDDRVFHARENFKNTFDQTTDKLRDNKVLSFETADINEMTITKDQSALTLTRTPAPEEKASQTENQGETQTPPAPKMVWQSADGKLGEDANVNRLLSTLSNLRCKSFIDDRKKEDFTTPLYTVQLKGGQNYALSIFAKPKEEDPNYPATSSASDYPFLLAKSISDRIMKNPEDLLKKPKTEEKKPEAEKPAAEVPETEQKKQ
jgi:hypothetical protein